MTTTHVFIVDSNTFNVHLKYLFAGTGARDYVIDFNNAIATNHRAQVESMLVAMSADAMRIRQGDKIIFYLQQNFADGIFEGKFFGVFKANTNCSFLDNNDGNQHLHAELGKSLFYRTLIRPDNVYAEGITEWEALEEIRHIQSPNQMLWSLIYRKLKGNRGNTMITIYESERLCQLIRNKNNRTALAVNNNQLSFDADTQKIIVSGTQTTPYNGRQTAINFLPRLLEKYKRNRAFEAHLQEYIVQNIGLGTNLSLDSAVLGENVAIEWLGNEVSCGVGMQRIDVALSINDNGQRVFMPIELKAVEASIDNVRQISRYVDWVEQYYIPNRQSDILPVVIAKKFADVASANRIAALDAFRNFNATNAQRCRAIKYIEYEVINGDLHFSKVSY